MPNIPNVSTLNTNTAGILNTIRDNASDAYREAVPTAKQTTESIRAVGEAINGYEARRNEFLNALVNRIAFVLVTSKSYQNPLKVFKRGILEYGETVEEVFVRLCEPHQYDAELAETEVFKRELPDLKTMFHPLNYKKFYKTTFSNEALRQAFLSPSGVTDLIARIVEQLYTSMQYDEYIMMKYMIYTLVKNNSIAVEYGVDPSTSANAALAKIKAVSNKFRFMSTNYNCAGVENYTDIADQYLISAADTGATLDVEALAKAFNLSYAEFVGKQIMVDSFKFSQSEIIRLNKLLESDPDYVAPDNSIVDSIGFMLVDKDWFMIFDNLMESTNIYNPQNLCWNQFLHTWKTFSVSPFANACVFSSAAETTGSGATVTVTGAASVAKGKSSTYTATLNVNPASGFGVWSIVQDTGTITSTTISDTGVLSVGADETATKVRVTFTTASGASGYKAVTIA